MYFTRTNIPDVIIIEPKVHGDDRGYFVETFRADKLEEFLGYKIKFCQDNESKSSKGVLRGLHYQLAPAAQTKLVRVIQGSVIDGNIELDNEAIKSFVNYLKYEYQINGNLFNWKDVTLEEIRNRLEKLC